MPKINTKFKVTSLLDKNTKITYSYKRETE
jgi:hypothetical protein